MVYEDHDEIDLAEEDRLYEQDPYQVSEVSDTFREQLNDTPMDEESLNEEGAAAGTGPMSEESEEFETDDFGETVMPASSEDEMETEEMKGARYPLDEE